MDPTEQVYEFTNDLIMIGCNPITNVLCFEMSLTKKYSMIGTRNGFCVLDNAKRVFSRYEGQQSPFHLQDSTQEPVGVRMGAVVEERTEVAVIPARETSQFHKNTVYIYDYQLRTILYSNDFFLPIRQISITDDSIIVANNKRLVLYNYSDDTQEKTQAYYLRMYESQLPNPRIRYLQTMCEERLASNTLQDYDQRQGRGCKCGRYAISGVKPYRVLYCSVFSNNLAKGVKKIRLNVFDYAVDKEDSVAQVTYSEQFEFTISMDGGWIAYTENEGRQVHVRKYGEQGIYCSFAVSMSIKPCLSHGFFYAQKTLYYTMTRKANDIAHMHFFTIKHGNATKKCKRVFELLEKLVPGGTVDKAINCEFFQVDQCIYTTNMSGYTLEVVDFRTADIRPDKKVESFVGWEEATQ